MKLRGITKIEIILVIVLVIIVIIANFFIISYLNNKNRDVQVLSEVKQIRSALDLFFLVNNRYPEAEEVVFLNDEYAETEKLCLSGFSQLKEACDKPILNPVPNYFKDKGSYFAYQSIDNNQDYKLEFFLITNLKNQGLQKGKICASSSQLENKPCY